ncbi:MAG TPA: phage major capsid protein [Rariglobus sp.]|jgi:HK97 family phage major capsid protein|nr:phage major capsid protein [Rariglobus sp.]
MKKFLLFFQWLAAATLLVAHNIANAGGLALAPLSLSLTDDAPKDTLDQQLAKSLTLLNQRMAEVGDLKKTQEAQQKAMDDFTKILNEVKQANDTFRKQMLEVRNQRARRGGEVSDDCAKFLGAIGLIAAAKTPGADLKQHQLDMIERQVKGILGMELKSALTTSDIPLPVNYGAEVVELVFQYGQARKVGTVFPMGAGTIKLPKLGTDTDWGLIGMSGTVTEVSPGFAWVTFAAEKFGGLIRLPSEIDEDSIVAMGQFIARYAARKIAKCEDYQFFLSTGAGSGVNGTGEGLAKAVVTDSCYVYQGGASNSGKTKPSQATLADFRAMRNESTLSGVVLNSSKYYMHSTYEALLVTFNTSATVVPYQRANGTSPATLDGFEIVWTDIMPAYTTSATVSVVHALFGDASYQYLTPRGTVRMDTSREAGFATDEILIRGLERFTVGLMASKAVAGLRCSAS